jgi:hypothetical protein
MDDSLTDSTEGETLPARVQAAVEKYWEGSKLGFQGESKLQRFVSALSRTRKFILNFALTKLKDRRIFCFLAFEDNQFGMNRYVSIELYVSNPVSLMRVVSGSP